LDVLLGDVLAFELRIPITCHENIGSMSESILQRWELVIANRGKAENEKKEKSEEQTTANSQNHG
jgi:hypothetical protein